MMSGAVIPGMVVVVVELLPRVRRARIAGDLTGVELERRGRPGRSSVSTGENTEQLIHAAPPTLVVAIPIV